MGRIITIINCGCGCGGIVKTPNKNGIDIRFVRGHGSRVNPTNVKKTCPGCHREFIATKIGQDYCSFDCHYPRRLCACGCGKEIPLKGRTCPETKYIAGHHWLGKKHTEEQLIKIGRASAGERNPNWQGGLNKYKYTTAFCKRIRFIIRDEYKNTRAICHTFCGKKSGHVHHIDYDKQNNDNKNLILLCKYCHGKTIPQASRNHWKTTLSRLRTDQELAL